MENQFVPSELAVKLRDLGYNEECFAHYRSGNFDIVSDKLFIQYNNEFYSEYNKNSLLDGATAPLWQQVFDWFRENHGLLGFIENGNIMNNIRFHAHINSIERSEVGSNVVREANLFDFISYEEARYACIEKLIELSTKK